MDPLRELSISVSGIDLCVIAAYLVGIVLAGVKAMPQIKPALLASRGLRAARNLCMS